MDEKNLIFMVNQFMALDGDNVGQKLELYSFLNDLDGLKNYSSNFTKKMEWLQKELVSKFDAEIIFSGGDNLMAQFQYSIDADQLTESLEYLFHEFQNVGNTISAGIGKSPREALIALSFAKSSGKNCIKFYGEYSS